MRVRTYGLILLGLAGIAPLAIYGGLAVQQSRAASMNEVCAGHRKLAGVILDRIKSYSESERRMLTNIGISILLRDRGSHSIDPYMMARQYAHLKSISVYERVELSAPHAAGSPGAEAVLVAGDPPPEKGPEYQTLADAAAIHGHSGSTEIEFADRGRGEGLAHLLTIAEPVYVVGKLEGAIVATYDVIGMWAPINEQRIGTTGYVALINGGGDLLAHGDAERRRPVYDPHPARRAQLRARYRRLARLGDDCLGPGDVVAASAQTRLFNDPGDPDAGIELSVIVEQSWDEAFAATRSLIRNLAFVGVGALLFVIAAGFAIGRVLVKALERLGEHTQKLGKDLEGAGPAAKSSLAEVRMLAEQLDAMAVDLINERDAARARERLATFARVAAGLAHDLRLPIETVRGACDMVNAGPGDPRSLQLLQKVTNRELPRLKRYVDDLQRLARGGDLGLEYDQVDPVALVEDVREELAENPKWRGIEFVSRGHAENARLDRNLIRRAIINLTGNAADACMEKLLNAAADATLDDLDNRVVLELEDSPDDDRVSIRVIDTGVGIPPALLATLHAGDFQSTKRSTGVGLGLGVVKQIATAHGGALTITSRVGEGSTFTLCLPKHRRSTE